MYLAFLKLGCTGEDRVVAIVRTITCKLQFSRMYQAMPWFRQLVAGLSPPRCEFASRSVHVGFVVDKVALGQVFLRVLQLSLVNMIPLWLSMIIYYLRG
jgi:small ligand-binding sensory domain FIST